MHFGPIKIIDCAPRNTLKGRFYNKKKLRFGKRGSNDEALRFLADMDQSYNGQVRPRWGKDINYQYELQNKLSL